MKLAKINRNLQPYKRAFTYFQAKRVWLLVDSFSSITSYIFHSFSEIEVLDVLKVAYKLDCSKLVARCETVLLNAVDVHPLDLLKISKKYNLESLKMKAINQASLEPKITCYKEFEYLDNNVQHAIIRRLLENSGANSITKFKGVKL